MGELNKIYDVVIIGSGIAGLLSAVLLGKEGKSVLVLEKNHQIGGSLQVFSRDKKIFDTGVHYIGSMDEGESLNKIFTYAGIIDSLKTHRLSEDCFDLICLPNGKQIALGQGYGRFKENLNEAFPAESIAIDKFAAKVQEICDFFPLYNLKFDAEVDYIKNPEIMGVGAWDYINSITDDEVLRSVLLGNGLLYAGEKKSTPLYVLALILNSFLKGSYRMIDGGSQIAIHLTKKIREIGGIVLKHQEVIESTFDGDKVIAVTTKQGDTFKGHNFISNAHPKQTVAIFGEENFRKAYRNRLKKQENTVSSFMLYLSLKKNSIPYLNHNLYIYNTFDVFETTEYSQENWPQAMFVCTPVAKDQGEFSDSMSIMAYMNFDEVKEWSGTFNTVAESSERGNSYEAFKRRKEEQVISELEKTFPNIRDSIENVYCSTPLTYKDYIGTEDGTLYGIKKEYSKIMHSKINDRTRISNVYQTGQNIVFHGVLGASIGALVTCFNFIDRKELIEKIQKA